MGIDAQLTKEHPLFNGSANNVNAVIITTPQTQHGPEVQRRWLKNTKGLEKKPAESFQEKC